MKQEIVVEEIFPHAPQTIWKALTAGELIARWLHMTPSGFAPHAGTKFTYQTTPAGEWDGVIRCEVLEVVPEQRLVYAWRGGHETNAGYGARLDTIVTFTLAKDDKGTRLRVIHSGFELPRNETAYRNMSGGWKKVIHDLGDVAGGRK
ncbi:MAG TPA: SRPBCC domain-containing protein [Rhizomicrobium sp.]|jgi:uncharacterized protein YndB with AHSA1/START domain|nr:SRPBCC domain-containing protein [Rhizomicrobium sp.]